MNADLLKTCLREIEHIIFDAKEKVTARRISNNWDIDVPKAVDVLQKWIDEQKDKAKLSLEYIVRGVDKNGNAFMTLVKADKLQNVCKLYPKSVKMLYSAEVASEIRPMNVSVDSEFSIKNLRLEPQKRQIDHRSSAPAPSESVPVKQEKKPEKKNLFGTVSKPSAMPMVVKEEKPSPPPTPAAVKTEPLTQPATIKVSPKKQSPKKDTKKVVNGKGSISSFFSSKPGQTAAPSKVASTGTTVKQEAESPTTASSESTLSQKQTKPTKISESIKEEEKTRKRTITYDDDERSDEDKDVIPSTPQEEKRGGKKRAGKPLLKRKKTANPSKKSRIMEICDSSSDDDEMNGRDAAEEKRKERLVEFDEEMAEPEVVEKQKCPSPEKPVENDSNSANRTRGKVKKMVTKTFTDDDGYLITVKEWEMVSEDESQENGTDKETDKETGNATSATVPAAKSNKTATLGSQTKATSGEKKATPPTPKTKQGSIMSFFAKK